MTKMLLVSHEASLTGAPRVAVEILRASGLVDERVVLVRWPGPLSADLEAAADRCRSEPLRRSRVALRRFRPTRPWAAHVEEAAARFVLRRERPDLVYLNTVKSACYIRPAVDLGCRVILHSHEMNPLASQTLARYSLEDLYPRIQLAACSESAKRCLAEITGEGDIEVVPTVIDWSKVQTLGAQRSGSAARTSSGLAGDSRLVTSCGTADLRKGIDLWLDVARQVTGHLPPTSVNFVWIGDDAGGWERRAADMGLTDEVHFLGVMRNPYTLIGDADIVVVPSRQDASPLVILEAMSLGRPIVAFDVGGIREQLGEAGVLIPAGDADSMTAAIIELLADPDERSRLGGLALQRVRAEYGLDRLRAAVTSMLTSQLSGQS